MPRTVSRANRIHAAPDVNPRRPARGAVSRRELFGASKSAAARDRRASAPGRGGAKSGADGPADEAPVRPGEEGESVAERKQSVHDGLEAAAAAMEDKLVIANEHHSIDEEDQHREEEPQRLRAQGGECQQNKEGQTPARQGQYVGTVFAPPHRRLPGAVLEPVEQAAAAGDGPADGDDPELQRVGADVAEPGETGIRAQQEQARGEEDGRHQHGTEGTNTMTAQAAPGLPGVASPNRGRYPRALPAGKLANHVLLHSRSHSMGRCTLQYKVQLPRKVYRHHEGCQAKFSAFPDTAASPLASRQVLSSRPTSSIVRVPGIACGRSCFKSGATRRLLNFLCQESAAWEVGLRRFFVRLPDGN